MPNIITEVELPEGRCRVSVVVNSNVIKPTTLVGMGLHREENEELCPECDSEKRTFVECDGEEECEDALNEADTRSCETNAER